MPEAYIVEAVHQRGQAVRGEVGGVHRGQRAATAADRCTDRFDDVGLRHRVS